MGKEITETILQDYLTAQHIKLRLIDGNRRIVPQISTINQEYRASFKPLQEGLIQRNEFEKCTKAIKNEQNLIISGNAGYGKSGCTEAIIDYCEIEKIPYIAIKMDRKIPQKNCDIWGQQLGFPGSISYALHSISKNKRAVIILDQLDNLRWTQANSSEALSVCMELIKQVRYLNYEREYKIIIVFVCRAYDLHNDNNIKALFETESNTNQENNKWERVVVQFFDEDVVERIIVEKYKIIT
ncbi:AAA family ATPase [Lacrimispora celerecrescens]|uniref:AAA family ATPase n=1 Tax=Lacrimispora celerecrescens TaxID=29354 RepID=UPI00068EAD5C|nr:AAA family ATPase [Lacrimispora celerecrescens]